MFRIINRQNRKNKHANKIPHFERQEAQLSQRDRATLRVTEYFAESLMITQGHSK